MFSLSCASPVRFKLCLVGPMMAKTKFCNGTLLSTRQYSRICPPPPARAVPFTHVADNISKFGSQKKIQKPRQLLSLPAFPAHLRHPLPGKKTINHREQPSQVNAATWLKYYFDDVSGPVIQTHFDKGLVLKECSDLSTGSKGKQEQTQCLQKINPNEAMEVGVKLYVPVSVAEAKISKRIDTIPSGTLYPNADEIEYLQRLVMYKDSAIMILNKPPKLPVKGNLPVHNSMDALASAALTFGFEEGPKLVHRLDRESSGLLLMGRTKESIAQLHWLFSDTSKAKSPSKLLDLE